MFDPTDPLGEPAGWLLVVFVANLAILLAAQALLVVGLGSGFGGGRDRAAGSAPERRADAADGRVRCPNCRTANEAGYRYCRECLDELPGSGFAGAGDADPWRRPLP